MALVDLQHVGGDAVVQVDRQVGDAPAGLELADGMQQQLRRPGRMGRQQHHATARGRAADQLGQARQGVGQAMLAVAVGGLDQHLVGSLGRRSRRAAAGRRCGPASPACSSEWVPQRRCTLAAPSTWPVGRSRATKPGAGSNTFVEGLRLQPLQRALGHVLGVQRHGGCVLGVAHLVGLSSLLFQQPAGFGQQQLAQLHGGGRGKHRAFETQLHQSWQEAAVGRCAWVSTTASIERLGTARAERLCRRNCFRPWNRPQSSKQPAAFMFDDHLRPGDGARAAQKAQLHSICSHAAPRVECRVVARILQARARARLDRAQRGPIPSPQDCETMVCKSRACSTKRRLSPADGLVAQLCGQPRDQRARCRPGRRRRRCRPRRPSAAPARCSGPGTPPRRTAGPACARCAPPPARRCARTGSCRCAPHARPVRWRLGGTAAPAGWWSSAHSSPRFLPRSSGCTRPASGRALQAARLVEQGLLVARRRGGAGAGVARGVWVEPMNGRGCVCACMKSWRSLTKRLAEGLTGIKPSFGACQRHRPVTSIHTPLPSRRRR